MKGDIAFVGFVITAEEWRDLDAQSRAQLCAVATRSHDPWVSARGSAPSLVETPTEPLAEGSGPLEVEEYVDLDLND